MHLLTQGDDHRGIQDATLNDWFRETESTKDIVVIIDGYTEDRNLNAYYANRENARALLHSTRSNRQRHANATVTPSATPRYAYRRYNRYKRQSTTQYYRKLRVVASPSRVSWTEFWHRRVMSKWHSSNSAPALKIATFPEGADISINDVEVGSTPKLITENLQQGTSTVTVKKAGIRHSTA